MSGPALASRAARLAHVERELRLEASERELRAEGSQALSRPRRPVLTLDGQPVTLRGFIPYGRLSTPLHDRRGAYRERLAAGAFRRCLAAGPLVACLWRHDQAREFCATDSGLQLQETDDGLRIVAPVPGEPWALTAVRVLPDGGQAGWDASFGFRATAEAWSVVDGQRLRTVQEATLLEVTLIDSVGGQAGAYPHGYWRLYAGARRYDGGAVANWGTVLI